MVVNLGIKFMEFWMWMKLGNILEQGYWKVI